MTPLAASLVGRKTLPIKRRPPFNDQASILPDMDDIHCFEVSAVRELIEDYGNSIKKVADDSVEDADKMVAEMLAFLPAPKTWIEWLLNPDAHPGMRGGILLEAHEKNGKERATIRMASSQGSFFVGDMFLKSGDCVYSKEKGNPQDMARRMSHLFTFSRCALALINTPRIIGRKQHMPNVGLERKLAKSMGMVGRFPLHAWTEIKLQVSKPLEIDDGEPHEAHLTGRRALHFCRAHIRIRLGKLEYVSSHWRGDPAIGIKRSRYAVLP